MQFLSVLAFACALSVANSAFRMPFYSKQISPDSNEIGLYSTFKVGTPAQEVKAYLQLRPLPYSPVFKLGKGCKDGMFNRKKSKTFRKSKIAHDPQPDNKTVIYGRDTFDLPGSGPTSANIAIQEDGDCSYGAMSFGKSNKNWSFVRDSLKNMPRGVGAVAVFAFKEVGNDESEPISGTLTIGDNANDICTNWIMTPTVPFSAISEDWGIPINKINIGNSYSKTVSANMEFKKITYGFGVPSNLLSGIKNALKIDGNDKVACNTKTLIKLQTGYENIIIVGPHVYADLKSDDGSGQCKSRVYDSKQTYHMPITFFRGKCQILDYSTGDVGYGVSNIAVDTPDAPHHINNNGDYFGGRSNGGSPGNSNGGGSNKNKKKPKKHGKGKGKNSSPSFKQMWKKYCSSYPQMCKMPYFPPPSSFPQMPYFPPPPRWF